MDEQIRSFREQKKDFGQKNIIQKQNSKLKSLRNKINNENLNLYIRKKSIKLFFKNSFIKAGTGVLTIGDAY